MSMLVGVPGAIISSALGGLATAFSTEHVSETVDATGRPTTGYAPSADVVAGVLSSVSPNELEQFAQQQQRVTHALEVNGPPLAGVGDRLTLGARQFYVRSAVQPVNLPDWTHYVLEERGDVA